MVLIPVGVVIVLAGFWVYDEVFLGKAFLDAVCRVYDTRVPEPTNRFDV